MYVLAYGFVEMAFGTVWGVGWLVMFRELFNSKPKKFGATLIGAAYGVYLCTTSSILSSSRRMAGA
jgi:hypothetical protein